MEVAVNNEGMNEERFKRRTDVDRSVFQTAVSDAMAKVRSNLDVFQDKFLTSSTVGNVYSLNVYGDTPTANPDKIPGANVGWTTGFWTGILNLAYELTGEQEYLYVVERQVNSFEDRIERKIDVNTHDIGFLYSLSCVAAYKLTGNETAKAAAIRAADHLMTRYVQAAGIIQAWGNMDDPNERGRMIIDCLMNLPLLYWASEVTGDGGYKDAAYQHALNAYKYIVREDGTTFHTYFFDVFTGEPLKGKTVQGYSDDSCWARGQAWGIYGFALSYVYTKDVRFLEMSKILANYFLNRSPEDLVVYWDLEFTDGSDEPKDSSSSAIAVCGLLELVKHLSDEEEKQYFFNAAMQITKSMYEHYSSRHEETSNALLLHGVYFKMYNHGVDEANLWGDYFYLEALTRITKDWNLYW
ncbi:glycoside hydrolase family 88 protein [Paenibacillus sp.]|uniref:glycoside hydrolase family 88 protein n=1 Tax=Paenibacillus sp. TaxID=58172 RepID=UPI002D72C67B|nr:glycoside hydrolase family 88 protein [Paenibacillus sp.]HZG87989.1 glycoside hydrolase family 88 protein [Paenibacillus sp.]